MSMGQLTSQITVIFLLMLLGALVRKLNFLKTASISDLTNLLLYFIGPLVIIKAFERPFSISKLKIFFLVALALIITYIIMIVASHLLFRKITDQSHRAIANYGSIFSNCGFIGISLAQALFGSDGVFYAVISMMVFNIFSWTYGISLFGSSKQKKSDLIKQAVLNPNIIAIVIGFVIFVLSIDLPNIANQFLDYTSASFTPLSMIVIGSNLAGMQVKNLKLPNYLWLSIFLRNLIYPLMTAIVLKLLNITSIPMLATVILAACPMAGVVSLFSLQTHGDAKTATITMSLSTILSLITIPVVFTIVKTF